MTREKEIERAAELWFGQNGGAEFIYGAKWADDNVWKKADGDDLPDFEEEVIALVKVKTGYKVVFAHRPNPEGDAQTFEKGGWNQPDIEYWQKVKLPNFDDND